MTGVTPNIAQVVGIGDTTTPANQMKVNPDGSIPVAANTDAVMDNATASGSVTSAATLSFTNATTPRGPFSAAGVQVIDTTGYGSFFVQIVSNPSTNTLTVEGSNDGVSSWSPISVRVASLTGATGASGSIAAAAINLYQTNQVAPFMRVRVSTFVGGTTSASVGLKRGVPSNVVDAFVGNAVTVQPAAASGTTGRLTPVRIAAGASGVLKASGGAFYLADLQNTNAATRYMQIYNKATAGIPGTDTPIATIIMAASSLRNPSLGDYGFAGAVGLSWAVTSDFAGATIAASGDIVGTAYVA